MCPVRRSLGLLCSSGVRALGGWGTLVAIVAWLQDSYDEAEVLTECVVCRIWLLYCLGANLRVPPWGELRALEIAGTLPSKALHNDQKGIYRFYG